MALKEKIYENVRGQMLVAIKADRLRADLKELDGERERLAGAISILSEFFQEETGQDLQKVINTDPEWGKLVEKAQTEAQQIAVGANFAVNTQVAQPESPTKEVKGPSMPKLRSNTGNKTVQEESVDVAPEPEAVAPKPEPLPQLNAARGRPPVRIVIDDNPPGPGTPDKPDPT